MTDRPTLDLPRRTVMGGLAALVGAGATGTAAAQQRGGGRPGLGFDVHVRQPEGRSVNWVLPGPRPLSEAVFGTPDNPMLGDDYIQHVMEQRPMLAPLLEEFPFEVGVPESMRETNEAGDRYTVTSVPTPFGDRYHPTEGELDLGYRDRAPWAGFRQATDDVEFDLWFTDPDGNRYTAEVAVLDDERTEHAGGVLVGGQIHGSTGIGTPLMTRLYNYASFWGVGSVSVNEGETVLDNRLIHFMTTQMVRDIDYALALDEEMPLEEPFLGRSHHTHGIFPPVEMTSEGPRYAPLEIPFQPQGVEGDQPFIHIMYDQDEVRIET